MPQAEFYKRVSALVDPAFLQSRRVAVVGLGSGGSRVAAALGRLGVNLLLIDRPGELLEEHNIVRHVLGYRSLGKSKLTQMSRHIRNLNTSVSITACSLDVAAQQKLFARRLQRWRPHVIAVCTDNQVSKHAINEVALRLGIPQTGGAVYDGGIGGEVYRVRPGQACYGCIAAQLQLDRHAPKPTAPLDYTSSQVPDAPSTCALGLDIEQIALLQSRITLDLLIGPENPLLALPSQVNLWVFANRIVPGTFARPFHAEFFSVPRQSDCLSCGTAPDDLDQEAARISLALGPSSS